MGSGDILHTLPPLKRLRLRFEQNYPDLSACLPPLPAKKRRRDPKPVVTLSTSTSSSSNFNPAPAAGAFCSPAKKRVWAPPPSDPIPKNPNPLLPAKKRGWVPPSDATISSNHTAATNTVASLPVKKRVWAPPPPGFISQSADSISATKPCLPVSATLKRRVWAPSLDIIPETPCDSATSCLPKLLSDSPSPAAKKRVLAPAAQETPTVTTAAKKKVVLAPAPQETTTITTTVSIPAKKKVVLAPNTIIPEIRNLTTTTTTSPARKRVLLSTIYNLTTTIPTSLPAQKRVLCAPPPNFHFDLNLDYYNPPPSFHKQQFDNKANNNNSQPGDTQFVTTEEEKQGQSKPEQGVRELVEKENQIESVDADAEAEAEAADEVVEEEDEDEDDDGIECAVCGSTDGEPSDPIVFCDGCDLMVHATCYGNPLIHGVPEGDWFCARCTGSTTISPDHHHRPSSSSISSTSCCCCLCPVPGGAVKPTNDGRWAHLLCALYVPEVFFEDPDGREGIDCSRVPKRRWERVCYVCGSENNGCVVECSQPKCDLCFHVGCGLNAGLSIEYKEGRSSAAGIVAGFCTDHTELWKKQQETGKFKIVPRD